MDKSAILTRLTNGGVHGTNGLQADVEAMAATYGAGLDRSAEYEILKVAFENENLGFSDLFYQTFEGINGRSARLGGVDFINFCSYDYIGMGNSPEVARAAIDAIHRYGTSVSASRLVSGERPIHQQLERTIADWIGTEDALTFVSGFGTNADTIGHLLGPGDALVYDSLIHASVREGLRLSGADARPFPHGDLDALERVLRRAHGRAKQLLIAVEGVYSMDGDIPDLPRLIDLKRRYGALLMVDEAHSLGVLGKTGRGISEHFGIAAGEVDIWMGTLSKALASCGGYIAGKRDLVSYLRHTAPAFVFSVGLAPPLAGAALRALTLLAEEPERVETLRQRSALFHALAKEAGLDIGSADPRSAIVPIMAGEFLRAAAVARDLLNDGILALP
ncbi:MAG: aminotransferase class I/II-fold pyridoxal phosphate-dependent enzyme, partial [Devosia sp.]